MDVVVFGHIFQVRRGEVRGGMVVPWSCLGRVGNVNYGPPSTVNIPLEPHLQSIKMILCYFGRIPVEMLWKMLYMST